MSYDYSALAAEVKAALETDPKLILTEFCRLRGIDRHTVNRALRHCLGVRFSDLRAAIRGERSRRALTADQTRPIKHAALDAGYSSSSALAKQTRKQLGQTPTAIRHNK